MRYIRKITATIALCLAAVPAFAADCNAVDYATLTGCIQSGNVVHLKADIVLGVNQRINISGVSDLTIDGLDNTIRHRIDETAARFQANSAGSDHFFNVDSAQRIKIRNIRFDSTPATVQACVYSASNSNFYSQPACLGSVLVNQSSEVELTGNAFSAHKTFQLQIVNSNDLTVDGNAFSGAATYGVWTFSPVRQNRVLRIINNTFSAAGANAIMLTDANDVWVGGNTFDGNHVLTQYSGYGGGQIVLEDSTRFDLENVAITGNVIRGGTSLYANGIEFANFDVGKALRNVSIAWNRIESNPSGAIAFDLGNANARVENVSIKNNEFVANGGYKSQVYAKAYNQVFLGNNYIESTAANVSAGFDGTSPTCVIPAGSDRCSIEIKWNVKLVRGGNLIVTVREPGDQSGGKAGRGLFAGFINGNGSQVAPWIGRNGAIFELYYESDYNMQNGWEAPLASVFVKGI